MQCPGKGSHNSTGHSRRYTSPSARVVRDGQGQLHINGSGENRNALLVNAMDVMDPATGQFGATIPDDSVESVNAPVRHFLPQYGRSTAGVVRLRRAVVETNGILRSMILFGVSLSARTPQRNAFTHCVPLMKPLIKNKLFLSQGIEYELKKTMSSRFPFL